MIHFLTIALSCLLIVGVNEIGRKSDFTDIGRWTFGIGRTSANDSDSSIAVVIIIIIILVFLYYYYYYVFFST